MTVTVCECHVAHLVCTRVQAKELVTFRIALAGDIFRHDGVRRTLAVSNGGWFGEPDLLTGSTLSWLRNVDFKSQVALTNLSYFRAMEPASLACRLLSTAGMSRAISKPGFAVLVDTWRLALGDSKFVTLFSSGSFVSRVSDDSGFAVLVDTWRLALGASKFVTLFRSDPFVKRVDNPGFAARLSAVLVDGLHLQKWASCLAGLDAASLNALCADESDSTLVGNRWDNLASFVKHKHSTAYSVRKAFTRWLQAPPRRQDCFGGMAGGTATSSSLPGAAAPVKSIIELRAAAVAQFAKP